MLRFYSKHDQNRVAVVGEFMDGKLVMAAARCSDKDNFCRKIGRSIAEGRLAKQKFCRVIDTDSTNPRDFTDFARTFADDVNVDAKLICD